MSVHLGPWDLALIVAVSLQATALAYITQPQWKAVVGTLPIPFTVAFLAVGQPVAASNVLGLLLFFLFMQEVRWLHARRSVPIVAAIFLATLSYSVVGVLAARILPTTDRIFWLASAAVWLLGIALLVTMPRREEPGHRSPLPIYLKLPIVAGVVLGLVLVKGALQGFATVFPMVSIVSAYEARHSLWTLGRQVPVLLVSMMPMMGAIHLVQAAAGVGPALLAGWAVLACFYVPLTWALVFRRRAADPALPQQV